MKGGSLDTILTAGVLIVLLVLLFKDCNKEQPVKQMAPEEIRAIIKENFDTLQADNMRVITSSVEVLKTMLKEGEAMTQAERDIISRIVGLDAQLNDQEEELKAYFELNTKTEQIVKETVYIRDTTGKPAPVPDYIKSLPLIIESHYQDANSLFDLRYDVQKDSISSHIITYNRFKLEQKIDKSGQHVAVISNDNPHTYTMPGTSIFELDVPQYKEPFPLSVGLQAGYYLTKDGHAAPGVGVGLSYDIGKPIGKTIVNLFKKNKNKN